MLREAGEIGGEGERERKQRLMPMASRKFGERQTLFVNENCTGLIMYGGARGIYICRSKLFRRLNFRYNWDLLCLPW